MLSGYITPDGPSGCTDPAICPARVLLSSLNVGAANFFTNAVDTKTVGVDVVAQYVHDLNDGGKLVWDAAYSHNQTKVEEIHSQSTLLPPSVLFDDTQVTLIEKGLPRDRGSIGATYSKNKWRIGVNNTYFGPVTGKGFGPTYHSGGKWLTDFTLNYAVTDSLNFTLGGNNVFNVKPDKWEGGFPFPELGFVYGWETLPFSLNGAYYYARVGWDF